MFRNLGKGDKGPSGIKPEMCHNIPYCSRYVVGPKMPALLDLGGNAQWELRGRVYCPKGVMPHTLFQGLEHDIGLGIFVDEVFFNITPDYEPSMMGDFMGYHVELSTKPMWPEWEYVRHSLQKMKTSDVSEPEDEGLPLIASHARGLITCKEMNRIDGLAPRRPSKRVITTWRATREKSKADIKPLVSSALSSLEGECLDVLYKNIDREAAKLHSVSISSTGSTSRLPWINEEQDTVKDSDVRSHDQTNSDDVQNDRKEAVASKKRPLRKRIMHRIGQMLRMCIPGKRYEAQ